MKDKNWIANWVMISEKSFAAITIECITRVGNKIMETTTMKWDRCPVKLLFKDNYKATNGTFRLDFGWQISEYAPLSKLMGKRKSQSYLIYVSLSTLPASSHKKWKNILGGWTKSDRIMTFATLSAYPIWILRFKP